MVSREQAKNSGIKGDASLEKYILSCALADNACMPVISGIISPEMFFYEANRIIYSAMVGFFDEGKGFDLLTLAQKVKRVPMGKTHVSTPYMSSLYSNNLLMIDIVKVEESCKFLVDAYRTRELFHLTYEIGKTILDDTGTTSVDYMNMMAQKLKDLESKGTEKGLVTIKDGIKKIVERSQQREDGVQRDGVMSGFLEMDTLFSGMMNGELHIVAGRPGMGKTEYAVSVSKNVAKAGLPVLMVSYEMDETQIVTRYLKYVHDFKGSNLRSGRLTDDLEKALINDTETITHPFYALRVSDVDDQTLRRMIRQYVLKYGIKLVIVDYLQLIADRKGVQGEEAVAIKSRALKMCATENNVPVIALAQLSRSAETRELKRPQLEDLKGSGAIEADADSVCLMYRPSYYGIHQIGSVNVTNQVKMIVAKFRDGAKKDVVLYWDNGQIKSGERQFNTDEQEDTDVPF